MQVAGGIIGLIAGIFGTFAALLTLFVGWFARLVNADDATSVVYLGWSGVLFSSLVIVCGAVAISSRGRIPGILLTLCAVAGASVGGILVEVFMALALVGGILAVVGAEKPADRTT